MQQMPEVKELMQKLQEEFNDRFIKVVTQAIRIVKDRAPLYDTQLPVWYRVSFPEGFLHEIAKKTMRIQGETHRKDFLTQAVWSKAREELLDIINYCGFAVACGDMLLERMSTGRATLSDAMFFRDPEEIQKTDTYFVSEEELRLETRLDEKRFPGEPPAEEPDAAYPEIKIKATAVPAEELKVILAQPIEEPEEPPKRRKLTLRRKKTAPGGE